MSIAFKSKIAKVGFGMLAATSMLVGSSALAVDCYQFTSNLKVGSRGEAVRQLQMRLNSDPATKLAVAAGTAGSMGNESTYFGPATRTAVMKYQAVKGFAQVGNTGPMTRAALNSSCSTTGGGVVTPTPTTGPVSAMLATTNPAASTLVAGQATANLAQFTFTGTGTVTNVVLQRVGVSSDSTLSNVYLFDGATRLTDAASVASNGMVTFNVPAGLFMVNGMKTITVKSDVLLGTSGQTVGVKLVSFMTSGSTTAMSANISGNIHSVASATLASVTAGTVTPSGATINPASNVTLWQSTLSISERDVMMKRLALRNTGSAPASAFQNFKLFVNGVQVGTAAGVDSMGYVTFDLANSPVTLAAGSRVVRVDADVVSGASRTVQFSLRQAADVDFVDSSFGVNVTPTSTPWAGTANTISGTSGGSLTIEKDVTSPSTNLTLGGNDMNLGTFKFTAYGEPIKIETLRATFETSDDDVNSLRNGRILVNGVQYGSSSTLLEDTTTPGYTSYTLNYTVYPGTPVMVTIQADAFDNDGTNNLTAGDTILAQIEVGSSNATRVDSLGSFNAPAATVNANSLTVASASISLTENTTYADQTVVLPFTNAKIGSWNLAGSSVEDVLLTTLSFDVDAVSDTTFTNGDLTNLSVVVKNSSGAIVAAPAPLGIVAAADNNFSINYTLVKNTNLTIELFANLASDGVGTIGAADSFKTDLSVTGTSMISGQAVSALDVNGQDNVFGTASITATVDASSPTASIVHDNQTVTTAAFRFAAVTSGYNVTDLTFTVADATAVSNVILMDGSTVVATKPGATTVIFNGLNWNVPANTNKVLTVQLQLGTVGIGAGSTGSALTTTLTAFTAQSVATGVSAAGTETNPAGAAHYVYAATPSIAKVTLSSDDARLQNGENTLVRFTISSNGGPIEWSRLFFEVSKSDDPVLTNATLWDVTGGANVEVAGTDTLTDVGAADAAGTIEFDATAVQSVSGSKTYELRITASAVDIDVDSVVTKLAQDAAFAASATPATLEGADADATIIWSDLSASGHSTSTTDWTTDYGVRNLPISQTISS